MKIPAAILALCGLEQLAEGHVINAKPTGSDEGGYLEVPDENRRRRGQSLSQEKDDEPPRELTSGTPMPVCDYSSTFSDSSRTRGFYFEAPTSFCIVGLSVPNEFNENVQNVQVFILDSIPNQWPTPTTAVAEIHAPNQPVGEFIPTEIQIEAGEIVGLLGAAGTSTMRNSYCAASQSPFATKIGGYPVSIDRFLAQVNIFKEAAVDVFREAGNPIGRVNMYYELGSCSGLAPTPYPTIGPSSSSCDDNECGTCNLESAYAGCDCPICQRNVCDKDSYCCDVRWDSICSGAAAEICDCPLPSPTSSPTIGDCIEPGQCGNCDLESAGTGCDCPSCEATICAKDPYCCENRWDFTCAQDAAIACECGERPSASPSVDQCPAGTCGDCDDARGGPGCECSGCEDTVCEKDEYCCDNFWDRKCVDLAEAICDCPTEAPSTTPSSYPSVFPTLFPSNLPSPTPSVQPSFSPSSHPSLSTEPSELPSSLPSANPTTLMPSSLSSNGGTAILCQGSCGENCGYCHLRQRGAGCDECPICSKAVCAKHPQCCEEKWDAECGNAAKTECSCCLD